jgi:hypothetical protein
MQAAHARDRDDIENGLLLSQGRKERSRRPIRGSESNASQGLVTEVTPISIHCGR